MNKASAALGARGKELAHTLAEVGTSFGLLVLLTLSHNAFTSCSDNVFPSLSRSICSSRWATSMDMVASTAVVHGRSVLRRTREQRRSNSTTARDVEFYVRVIRCSMENVKTKNRCSHRKRQDKKSLKDLCLQKTSSQCNDARAGRSLVAMVCFDSTGTVSVWRSGS